MQISTIVGVNMELTDAITQYAEERATSLEKYTSHIEPAVQMRIEVGKTTNHHAKGPYFRAEFILSIPGDTLRAEVIGEDLYQAIDDAKDEIKRQLLDIKEKYVDQEKRVVRPGKE